MYNSVRKKNYASVFIKGLISAIFNYSFKEKLKFLKTNILFVLFISFFWLWSDLSIALNNYKFEEEPCCQQHSLLCFAPEVGIDLALIRTQFKQGQVNKQYKPWKKILME